MILHDNGVYGLTKGQTSPTLPRGLKTKSLPKPNIQDAINPTSLALTSGYTFVARGYAVMVNHPKELIKRAIKHRGAAFIDVLQPCVAYNDIHTTQYYGDRIYRLEDDPEWNPVVHAPDEETEKKLINAWSKAFEREDKIPVGVFYQNSHVPTYEDRVAERVPSYRLSPPSTQRVALPNGFSAVSMEEFRELFADYIVKVARSVE